MKTIQAWTLLLIGLTLVGCAGQVREVPDFELAAPTTTVVLDASELPLLCEMTPGVNWSADCWSYLEAYEVISEFNTIAAQEYGDALRNAELVQREIINSAKVQVELSEIYREWYEAEQSGRMWDAWFYKIIIAGMVVGATL